MNNRNILGQICACEKWFKFSAISLFAIIAIVITSSSVHASSPVFIDADANGTFSVGELTFKTIQGAINAASSTVSQTIVVPVGTYTENIHIGKSLSILGSNSQATEGVGTIVSSINGGINTKSATITIKSNSSSTPIIVTLRNLNIKNGSSGINVLQNAIMVIDKNTITGYHKNGITFGPINLEGRGGVHGTISNNIIIGAGKISEAYQNGIQIAESNSATIVNNKISNHIYNGPGNWWATGILINSDDVYVANNTLNANQASIVISGGSHNLIIDNSITGNYLSQTGIMVTNLKNASQVATANSIRNNTISGGLTGIWTSYAYGNSYLKNSISSSTGNGIYSWGSDGNTFSDNVILGVHAITNDAWGFALDGEDVASSTVRGSSNNIISANTIKASDVGFWVSNNSSNNTFSSNVLSDNKAGTKGGVYSSSEAQMPQGTLNGQVLGVMSFNFLNDLYRGISNNDVKELQKVLIDEKFLTTPATSYFGSITKTALMKWQTKNNIIATGYFGVISRSLLNKK